MSSPTTTPSVLPAPAIRQNIAAKLDELIDALASHPSMQGANKHRTAVNTWDFANRTRYILSELDNIEAGRPVQHPGQIPDYRAPRRRRRGGGAAGSRGDPAKAREHMKDVVSRTMTIAMMVEPQHGAGLLAMMGLQPLDFGPEVLIKATAAMAATNDVE